MKGIQIKEYVKVTRPPPSRLSPIDNARDPMT